MRDRREPEFSITVYRQYTNMPSGCPIAEFPSNGTLVYDNNTSSDLVLPGDKINVVCPEGHQMFTRDYKLL